MIAATRLLPDTASLAPMLISFSPEAPDVFQVKMAGPMRSVCSATIDACVSVIVASAAESVIVMMKLVVTKLIRQRTNNLPCY